MTLITPSSGYRVSDFEIENQSGCIPPPDGFSLEVAWPHPSDRLRDEVVKFWASESALPEELAKVRARELMIVARKDSAGIAAVCTVRKMYLQSLGQDCFAYRTFVGRRNRARGLRSAGQLAWSLFTTSYAILDEQFIAGEIPNRVGLYMEVENKNLKRDLDQFVWTEETLRVRREVANDVLDQVGPIGMNVIYLGTTPKGDHSRIWYFTGGRIRG